LTHNFPTSGLKKQIFLEIEIRYIVWFTYVKYI
jgi:hypothetical protein